MARNNNNGFRSVAWKCDKPTCMKWNIRKIKIGSHLNDDTCDNCKLNIHEPLWKEVKESTEKL